MDLFARFDYSEIKLGEWVLFQQSAHWWQADEIYTHGATLRHATMLEF